MRGSPILWLLVAACGFQAQPAATTDGSVMASDASSGSGSDSGSGSGSSGSGSAGSGSAWPCGVEPNDPGANRAEITGHGTWAIQNLEIGGVNTRRVTVGVGSAVELTFGDGVAVHCDQGSTCAIQLQIGTSTEKTGCALAGTAVGNGFSIANDMGTADVVMQFGSAAEYQIMVDPATSSGGCTGTWTNGQPTDSSEIIAYVCVTP
ncbi:MAG TPA: hypothetical protein VGL61_05840 [Kofleriaceae bacterium]|jgi:hypothetical protein